MIVFTHPSAVGMTYCEHALFSARIGVTFALASLQAFIHALFPDIFIDSTTQTVQEIDQRLKLAAKRPTSRLRIRIPRARSL